MKQRNYLFVENVADLQFFCQVQVSKKFMATVDSQELELLQWMRDSLTHRRASLEQVFDVVNRLERKVAVINSRRNGQGPYLTFTFSSLKPDESGFIRIERTSGRHQSVLLPIIDCRGEVELQRKEE